MSMTTVEAIYVDGVLKPDQALDLPNRQRVRLLVEPLNGERPNRETAFQRLVAGIEGMNFRSKGPYPTRDELHDRR